ncbi:MAG: hypothetical protein AUI14_15110 [Actinobacteria bacterium 13_2_20CM_2_71_6]|nr:MAG: hypothetical protein AUI14_15110 [Actinobacteria bacterium 13_2_20CM_2_71_6]
MSMSVLRYGDEKLHYCDRSHRWIAPPEIEQLVWETRLRAHLDQHRTTMGGPGEVDTAWPPIVPFAIVGPDLAA